MNRMSKVTTLLAAVMLTAACATPQGPGASPLPPPPDPPATPSPSVDISDTPEDELWADLKVVLTGHAVPSDDHTEKDELTRGEPGGHTEWTLTCSDGGSGGTHPEASDACEFLKEAGAQFFVTPVYEACRTIYGGPEELTISGLFYGEEVTRTLKRTNGCEIVGWVEVLAGNIEVQPWAYPVPVPQD